MFGFVGPNGAGKTTAMRIVSASSHRTPARSAGVGSPPTRSRRRFGYMPEERGLYPKMRSATSSPTRRAPRTRRLPRPRGGRALDRAARDRRASRRQGRGALAGQPAAGAARRGARPRARAADPRRAVQRPRPGRRRRAERGADRRRARRGVPVIFSSHQLDLVERLCDAVAMSAGGWSPPARSPSCAASAPGAAGGSSSAVLTPQWPPEVAGVRAVGDNTTSHPGTDPRRCSMRPGRPDR